MNNKNKLILGGIGLLAGLALIFYLGTTIIPKTLVTLSKASASQPVSITDSMIIGQKIMAKADGVDKCAVNVFVLDKDGKGIKGKLVQLNGLGTYEAVSDDLGKASFELTSSLAGQYELVASVDGRNLSKSVKVTFR